MSEQVREKRVILPEEVEAVAVLGQGDAILRMIEEALGTEVVSRGRELILRGSEASVEKAERLLMDLSALSRKRPIELSDVQYALRMLAAKPTETLPTDVLLTTPSGKTIGPRTSGQKRYVEAMLRHDLVIAIGPAGTGKTYLAVAMAVLALKERKVQRLILTRPAVEAGEKLGFLPGDLYAKVDPYLRPLYDALYEMMGPERFQRLAEKGIIEVAPLAYMRGRTLNDSFIILDEAQNTTHEQMKMFLTRLGFGSKAVITGDITQIDLPKDKASGLVEVQEILRGVEGIAFVYLTETDVVRHDLVQKIVRAYEAYEESRRS
ncbi:MAG: PhoH family protein [Armatimonadota bacterium]|nr:PhoH family protein [Armatimonadota bacterium]MDR5702989.1 PhoH family protein [Armatimonadota bacterium]MDR7433713.1 PhoH family protein [Armatimonadota bacterium]